MSTRRTDEHLWRQIVAKVTAADKGGRAGDWSARKAQIAVQRYKAAGGGYIGPKEADNALDRWTHEGWRTRSGRPSLETGERYLPAAAIEALTPQEYAATTRAKRRGMERGQQYVPQPVAIAAKVAPFRRRGTMQGTEPIQTFPPTDAARRMLDGEIGGLVESVAWTLGRAALLTTGMALAGERGDLWKHAMGGSLAVQAFVVGWAALAPVEQQRIVPSYSIALSGNPVGIATTYAVRSAMVYAGMRAAGAKRRVWRRAFAGTAAIEAAVLLAASLRLK